MVPPERRGAKGRGERAGQKGGAKRGAKRWSERAVRISPPLEGRGRGGVFDPKVILAFFIL